MEKRECQHKNPSDTLELWPNSRKDTRRSHWLHIRVNKIELQKLAKIVPEKTSRSAYVRKKILEDAHSRAGQCAICGWMCEQV
jgi:hypothetical protein